MTAKMDIKTLLKDWHLVNSSDWDEGIIVDEFIYEKNLYNIMAIAKEISIVIISNDNYPSLYIATIATRFIRLHDSLDSINDESVLAIKIKELCALGHKLVFKLEKFFIQSVKDGDFPSIYFDEEDSISVDKPETQEFQNETETEKSMEKLMEMAIKVLPHIAKFPPEGEAIVVQIDMKEILSFEDAEFKIREIFDWFKTQRAIQQSYKVIVKDIKLLKKYESTDKALRITNAFRMGLIGQHKHRMQNIYLSTGKKELNIKETFNLLDKITAFLEKR